MLSMYTLHNVMLILQRKGEVLLLFVPSRNSDLLLYPGERWIDTAAVRVDLYYETFMPH